MSTQASSKLGKNIAYTIGSFFILAISGVLMNVVITSTRDASALGIFNITYAIYIITSQIAALGIHYSVLRHAAFHKNDTSTCNQLYTTALGLTLILGFVNAGIIYALSSWLGHFFNNTDIGHSIAYATLGLIFFPANKVLISYINAFQHMKAFAIFQSLRYIIVMAVVITISLSADNISKAALCFVYAESITTLLALFYIHTTKLVSKLEWSREWVITHLSFGIKGLLAGLLVEVNSRLDVLVLGAFLSTHLVGIYSFAAMLVDGLLHIVAMVRVNFNPVLVEHIKQKNWLAMMQLRQNSQKYLTPALIAFSALILTCFYIYSQYLVPTKHMYSGIYVLAILLTGLTSIGALIPFDNLMMVSGHPGYQTLQQSTIIFINLAVTLTLLPVLNIYGAAIGTVIGNLAGITFVFIFSKKMIGWNLISNRYSQAT